MDYTSLRRSGRHLPNQRIYLASPLKVGIEVVPGPDKLSKYQPVRYARTKLPVTYLDCAGVNGSGSAKIKMHISSMSHVWRSSCYRTSRS